MGIGVKGVEGKATVCLEAHVSPQQLSLSESQEDKEQEVVEEDEDGELEVDDGDDEE